MAIVRSRSVRIAVGIVVVCVGVIGLKIVIQNGYQVCGQDLRLARRYSFVDFGEAYGETEGKAFNVAPGSDRRLPVKIEDVLMIPKDFTLVRFPGENGELGAAVNRSGTCSIVVNVATGKRIESGFPGRSEPWIVTIIDSPFNFQ